jgi:hypothetical protein
MQGTLLRLHWAWVEERSPHCWHGPKALKRRKEVKKPRWRISMIEKRTRRCSCLDQDLARRHQKHVGVDVEGRIVHQELDDRGIPSSRGVVLISVLRTAPLCDGISVREPSINITTSDHSSKNKNGTVSQSFCARIPAVLHHGQLVGLVEPSARCVRGEIVLCCTWIEQTDSFPAVEILINTIPQPCLAIAIFLGTSGATRANCVIATKAGESAIGEVHARCTK